MCMYLASEKIFPENQNKAVLEKLIVVKKMLDYVEVYLYISSNLCYNVTIKSSDRRNIIYGISQTLIKRENFKNAFRMES